MSTIYEISDFSGGQSSAFPYLKMPSKYASLMQNCCVSESGGVEKIPGFVRVNADAIFGGDVATGVEYKKTDGTTQLLSLGLAALYKYVDDEATLVSGIVGYKYFAQFNNYLLIGGDGIQPKKYDGTNVTALGGTSNAWRKPHTHKGRVWWTSYSNKMFAYHSALDAPEDYTTADNAGYIDFQYILPRGDELLDIVTYVDLLVFFFRQHIVIYSGSDPTAGGDFQLVQLISGIGVVAPNCAIELGTDLVFIHDSGIKTLRQVVSTGNMQTGKDVSLMNQSDIIADIATALASNSWVKFHVAHYPAKSWILFMLGANIWGYSYLDKSWFKIVVPAGEIGMQVTGLFSTSGGAVYLTGRTEAGGFLYQFGTGWAFDGESVPIVWDGPYLRFSSRGYKGYPKLLNIITGDCGENVVLSVAAAFDQQAAMTENNQTAEPDTDGILLPLFGEGRAMQLSISNDSTYGPIEWNNILVQGDLGVGL